MIINRSFKNFKFRHRSKKNQIIYTSKKVKNDTEVINLINNFLREKNSFVSSQLKKVKLKVDTQYLEKTLTKCGNSIIITLIYYIIKKKLN